MSEQHTPPSPQLFFETAGAHQRTAALKAAVELRVFTAIGELGGDQGNGATASAIAGQCGADARGIRILSDYLVIIGFLTKSGDNYALTPDSAVFLDQRSPAYMGGTLEFLLTPMLLDTFRDLAPAVRKGGTAMEGEGTVSVDNPIWVSFARAMKPMMAMPAQMIAQLLLGEGQPRLDPARPLKVLDIAAGHGIFGITVAQHYPQAEITALDWPHVLEVATENAAAAGVSDRHHTLPGSAFEVDYGTGYDLVLITNFLHHFDTPTNEALLRKIRAALADGGLALTLEFVPNEDRISPPVPASFSLTMLASTPHGDAYTFPQLEAMFGNAGFARSEFHPLPMGFQSVMLSYK